MKSRYLNLAVWTWSLHSYISEWYIQCDIIYVLKKPLHNMTSVSSYMWCVHANTEENVLDLNVYEVEWWLPLERVERKVKIEMTFKWALDLSVGLPWQSSALTLPSDAGVVGSIPGQGTNIPQASWPKQENKQTNKTTKKGNITNSIKTYKIQGVLIFQFIVDARVYHIWTTKW